MEILFAKITNRKKSCQQPRNSQRREYVNWEIHSYSCYKYGSYILLIRSGVPVRSCFNILTIYRNDVYLNADCTCTIHTMRMIGDVIKLYKQACEHVVLHECLRRNVGNRRRTNKGDDEENGFRIAVMPDMKTLWHLV